jgi:hypothetical protein
MNATLIADTAHSRVYRITDDSCVRSVVENLATAGGGAHSTEGHADDMAKANGNAGKTFEADIASAFTRALPGCYVQRNGDNMTTRRIPYHCRCGEKHLRTMVMPLPSPPDLYVDAGEWAALIECKSTKEKRLAWDALSDHQADALQRFDALGEMRGGYLALQFDSAAQVPGSHGGFERAARAWLLPIEDWNLARVEHSHRKSLPMSWLEQEYPHLELAWKPGTGWQILGVQVHAALA